MEQMKDDSKYKHPSRVCDIVMKGGITSGVVYPGTVCKLAETYHFKSIGGTSAGAIAAAVTAAAELGRNNKLASYEQLENLPQWLGGKAPNGKSNLFSLFRPQPKTKALFNTLVAGIGQKKMTCAFAKIVLSAMGNFPVRTLLGGTSIFAFLWILSGYLLHSNVLGLVIFLLICVFLAPVVLLAFIAWGIIRAFARVPANFYGLCTGHSEPGAKTEALTFWLARYLDELAGVDKRDEPLTFRDLWGADNPEGTRNIDLRMMATNLTHGRPYTLPFGEKNENFFYFHPEEFRKLFSEKVVSWMETHPRKAKEYPPLCPLPAPADFPVIVAARMSLSFPLLISAVPLYAVDYTRVVEDQEPHPDEDRKPQICWFSDGGICSNFPVHYFDQPLPKWPTFAINLAVLDPRAKKAYANECEKVWMPETNGSGILPHWTRFDDDNNGLIRLFGFFKAILDTGLNWHDNAQLKVPGYRDRVAHVQLATNEGGLNLNMESRVISSLSERGRCAGEMLVERFDPSPSNKNPMSWDNHRWLRYRSIMALLEENLKKLYENYYYSPQPGWQSYEKLVRRSVRTAPSYKWRDSQQALALKNTEELINLAKLWDDEVRNYPNKSLQKGAPKPSPELRVVPKV